MFHPLDMAAEFSGPVVAVIGLHALLWQENLTLVTTVLLVHLWYALDHSANMNLPHTRHHKYINNMYSIYMDKYMTLKRPDYVRKEIRALTNN